MVEECGGHVKVSVVASRALVLDGRGRRLAVGRDLDLLATFGAGVTAAVLSAVQSDDVVRVVVVVTTSSESGGVEGGSASETSLDGGSGGKGGESGDGDGGEEHFDVGVLNKLCCKEGGK